ncbi:MAG: anaerobic ribonucleoside-triphosphate reductase [Bacteroidales bacterium]|nr:anaerobic ribonucleoside-triphosphate reductase [Bacteroidales bacterium]
MLLLSFSACSTCRTCSHIDKRTLYHCPECGSGEVDHATRVIGYLKKVSSFSNKRQAEEELRYYHKKPQKTV